MSTPFNVIAYFALPDKVFVLPVRTEAGNLEDEDAVVIEEIVHLAKERLVTTNSDMLYHTQH